MKELRDIKIDLLIGNQNPIIDLFNKITDGINIINCPVYNEDGLEFIYFANAKTAEQYHKDGEWIFYQDSKNEKFWTNYYKYWTLFESNFSLEYLEIKAITKYLVEETLKREVGTPFKRRQTEGCQVEEALKREVGTPTAFYKGKLSFSVEEALKREVGTPRCSLNTFHHRVEETLKREVGTTVIPGSHTEFLVEEALKREISPPSYNSKGKKRRVI